MRSNSLAYTTPQDLIAQVPEAAALLRSLRIDPTSRMRLAHAAEAASVNSDEVLAILEDQLRRRARRAAAKAVAVEHEVEHEYELEYA